MKSIPTAATPRATESVNRGVIWYGAGNVLKAGRGHDSMVRELTMKIPICINSNEGELVMAPLRTLAQALFDRHAAMLNESASRADQARRVAGIGHAAHVRATDDY